MRLRALAPVASAALLTQLDWRLGIAPAELRPIERVAELDCPMLIMAGSEDEHTTLAEARRLFAAAEEPKELAVFAGAAHVNLHEFAPAQYREKAVGFLEEYLHDGAAE